MVVTGLGVDDERRTLDYLSTSLASMVCDLNFTLFCVSHENAQGGTRGSKNIENVADLHIHLERDKTHEDEIQRNLTYMTLNKNRFGSLTGPAGILQFDPKTFRISEYESTEELPT